jgi:hypothetical protein
MTNPKSEIRNRIMEDKLMTNYDELKLQEQEPETPFTEPTEPTEPPPMPDVPDDPNPYPVTDPIPEPSPNEPFPMPPEPIPQFPPDVTF